MLKLWREYVFEENVTVSVSDVFQWCPGHSDILGNEWADSEAKEATKLAPSTAPPSISALKEKNTRQTMENWAKFIDRPRASPANKYLAVSVVGSGRNIAVAGWQLAVPGRAETPPKCLTAGYSKLVSLFPYMEYYAKHTNSIWQRYCGTYL